MSIETLARPMTRSAGFERNSGRVTIAPIIIKGPKISRTSVATQKRFDVRALQPFTPQAEKVKPGSVKEFTFDRFKPFPDIPKSSSKIASKPDRTVSLSPKEFVFDKGASAKGEVSQPSLGDKEKTNKLLKDPTVSERQGKLTLFYQKENKPAFGNFDTRSQFSIKPGKELERDIVKSDTKISEVSLTPSIPTTQLEKPQMEKMPKTKDEELPPQSLVLERLQEQIVTSKREMPVEFSQIEEKQSVESVNPETTTLPRVSQIEPPLVTIASEQATKRLRDDIKQASKVVAAYKNLLGPEWEEKKEVVTQAITEIIKQKAKVTVKDPIEWYCLTLGYPIKNVITPFSLKFPELEAWGEDVMRGITTRVEMNPFISNVSNEKPEKKVNKWEKLRSLEEESAPMICFAESLWSIWAQNWNVQGETIIGRIITPGKESNNVVIGTLTKEDGGVVKESKEQTTNAELCPVCLGIFGKQKLVLSLSSAKKD